MFCNNTKKITFTVINIPPLFLEKINKYSEEELVLQIRQKDQAAFSYLYDNYAAALYGVIYRMIEDEKLGEDILQEAFVKIWNNFSTYDTAKGRLFTWMLNLTRNLAIDTMRSKGFKKQQKISGDENSVLNLKDTATGIDRFDSMGLRKHVANLKADQRIIIDLAYFSGYTQDEISKQLDIPLGTVKTRMRAAITELKKYLQYT